MPPHNRSGGNLQLADRLETTLNVAPLPSGTYFLRVGLGDRHKSHTVTVVK
jgi:hypothetical protein